MTGESISRRAFERLRIARPRLLEPPLEAQCPCLLGLAREIGDDTPVVLLGSIATNKYVGPVTSVFGNRLLFPKEFVGRGDMSRGGLMLRCVRESRELEYVPVATAVRHGKRPPKLDPMPPDPSQGGEAGHRMK